MCDDEVHGSGGLEEPCMGPPRRRDKMREDFSRVTKHVLESRM